ncbi:MAG: carbohydrate-binding domain-containing protein, partial [Clostridia bacterium]|nr:carbohydrate-binding domain-containing protein [Clostridia bacterium]
MLDKENYIISSSILNITTGGDYKITGKCSECQIVIEQGINVSLTINSIGIDNSKTCPFLISKKAKVNLILEGESSITDDELTEDSESFEGAGIKFKKSSSLTINGEGKLKVISNIKNGIKGGEKSSLTIDSGNLEITAVNNGLACDNLLTINGGSINIISQGDGIKAEPDSDNSKSEGTIKITGGEITINSQGDAIQAGYKLLITGGTFDITTFNGASASGFDEDTMSAKGLKCSTNEHENITNVITISGGTFVFNTRDDAIHSDYNVTITGGNFQISTGDDGVHAEKYLILGEKNADNSLIDLKITKSYEGLEGAYIYIYSGKYSVISSDDGINAAGDTDESCSMGGGNMGQGGRAFRNLQFPGGNMGGQGGPQGGFGGNDSMNGKCFIFYMNIYGGEIYINCESDGLDANGNITISGGNLEIWGMKSGGDGDPIDVDGTLTITGGTILAGGSQGMEPPHKFASTINQEFIYSTNSYSANKEISIKDDDNVIKTFTVPKQINYLFYTSKETSTDYKFSDGTTYSREDALSDIGNENNSPWGGNRNDR